MKAILLFLLVMGVGSLRAQLVQIGPPDPNFCEKIEKQLKPNLELTSPLIVRGLIVDQTGALSNFPASN